MPLSFPILAIDAARGAGSLVLALSPTDWRGRVLPPGQNQASDLLPEVQALLQTAGLSLKSLKGFVLGQGPGSFTGLRIAAGLAQGMARGLGVGVASVSGFVAVAYAARGRVHRSLSVPHTPAIGSGLEPVVHVFFDARLGETFYAPVRFSPEGYPEGHLQEPSVMTTTASHEVPPVEGMVLVDPQIQDFVSPLWPHGPEAEDLALRSVAAWSLAVVADAPDPSAGFLAPFLAQPLYVRHKVAQTREERGLGPALKLEPMISQDLASVMVIENQAYAFPWTSGNFRDALAAGYTALKLVDQGSMVGYCVYMRILEEAHLLNFTIAPARQRRGLGQAFLERLLSRMKTEGAASALLEVRPSNDLGIRLYQRNGFIEIGRRKGYYPAERNAREDALVMQKVLAAKAESIRDARTRAIAAETSHEATVAMAQAVAPELRS